MLSDPDLVLTRSCWCSQPEVRRFSEGYYSCAHCGTLISAFAHDGDVARVTSDDSDLYGKDYWFGHMEQNLGFANIYSRARTDLAERCLYWLRALLRYRTPPARVLELGSAHGGFVAVLKAAGFDVTGLELSPSIAQIARDLHGVEMLVGPVEDQTVEPRSCDVIAMMDVLEHLPDPVATIQRCVELLKPDGTILIQTPRFPDGCSFDELQQAGNRFLEMLQEREHLYLFSERSVRQLFAEAGLGHLTFEAALFSHYDMFFLASRDPLTRVDPAVRDQALQRTPGGRLVLAALDLREQLEQMVPKEQFEAAELDRNARLHVIEDQGLALDALRQAGEAMTAELESLRRAYQVSEADREARLRVIEQQGDQIGEIQHNRAALAEECERLRQAYLVSEDERRTNLRVIEQQGQTLESVQRSLAGIQDEILRMRGSLESAEQSRGWALDHLQRQSVELSTLAAVFAESSARVAKLEQANKEMEQLMSRGIFQFITDRLRGRS